MNALDEYLCYAISGGFILTAEEASLQLQSEFASVHRDWNKVVSLFNHLYGHRRSRILQKDIPLSGILELFPSLSDIKLVGVVITCETIL